MTNDFHSAENVARRAEKRALAAACANFLGLPTLKGTEKQVAWAEAIRTRFQNYCESCMYSDEFLLVAKRKDAKQARYWIENRTEQDFEILLNEAVNAAA